MVTRSALEALLVLAFIAVGGVTCVVIGRYVKVVRELTKLKTVIAHKFLPATKESNEVMDEFTDFLEEYITKKEQHK